MAAEGQSNKMVSNVEVCLKQSCVIEFLHAEEVAPTEFHGDQRDDVSTVKRWVVHFSSDDSNSGSPLLVQIFMSSVQFLFLCW